MTLHAAIEKFNAHQLREAEEENPKIRFSTVRGNRYELKAIAEYFGGAVPLGSITPLQLEDGYIEHRREQRITGATIANELHCLSKLFRYGIKRGWCPDNPVRHVEIPRGSAYKNITVSPQEETVYFSALGKLMAAPRKKSSGIVLQDLHDLARLMLLQGCRPSELLALTVEDVDGGSNTVTIRTSKTKSGKRTLPLHPESLEILRRKIYGTFRSHDDVRSHIQTSGKRLFSSSLRTLDQRHRRLCKRLRMTWTLYRLRHTFASRLGSLAANPHVLKSLLGHSSYALLPRYVHIGLDAMREEMLKVQSGIWKGETE